MRWRAWALPGLRVKRWASLMILGLLVAELGAAAVAVQWVRPSTWGAWGPAVPVLGVGALLLGAVLLALGLTRIVANSAKALKPETPLVEALVDARARRMGPRIVAIGGGTGLSSLLRGLKHHTELLTAIVTVADDGGSSGRLRSELGLPAPGDLRNCLVALAPEERVLTELFAYRFEGDSGLGGHSFGNLFLAALAGVAGDLHRAARLSSRVLAIRGRVLPATLADLTLVAQMEDGTEVRGESAISKAPSAIQQLWCEPSAPTALPEAVRAIEEAELVVLGPGSLYTSLVPHLLIPELAEALRRSKAPKVYVCNVMTQPGETDGFSAADHVAVLERYGGPGLVQAVLVNTALPQKLLARYAAQQQMPVQVDEAELQGRGLALIKGAFLEEGEQVRHAPGPLALSILEAWEQLSKASSLGRRPTGPLGQLLP